MIDCWGRGRDLGRRGFSRRAVRDGVTSHTFGIEMCLSATVVNGYNIWHGNRKKV